MIFVHLAYFAGSRYFSENGTILLFITVEWNISEYTPVPLPIYPLMDILLTFMCWLLCIV